MDIAIKENINNIEFKINDQVYILHSSEYSNGKLFLYTKNKNGLFDRARTIPENFIENILVYDDIKQIWKNNI